MGGRQQLLALTVVGLCLSGPARAGEYEDNMMRLTEHQPHVVAVVIHRLVECNRWAGDEPLDLRAYRRAPPQVRALKCDSVHADERALRRRYAKSPDVLNALTEARGYIP